ncbi:MAG: efflux RND transporter periplasmic adaptor subunit, partial [Parvibaculales bacterium]
MIDDKAADLGKLLTLEQEVRQAETLTVLTTLICNRSRDIIDYTQAALAVRGASGQIRITGFSDIAVLDRTAPLVTWLETQLKKIDNETVFLQPTQEECEAVADLIPDHILIMPLRSASKGLLGAFIVTRTLAFSDGDMSVLAHLGSVYGHALATHSNTPILVRIRARLAGRRKWAIAAGLLLASLIPVRLTAVAPAEITATAPFIVASPMQGVVDSILVKPNEKVSTGAPLLKLVDIELKSNLEIARRAFRIAEAELLRGRQLAFSSQEDKAQLAELTAQVELRRAEMNFAQDQLARATVTAPNGGLIMLDDPRKWQGRPVVTGQQIMKLAQPQFVEVEVQVPVADAVTLSEGSRVDVFLDIDPIKR